MERDRVEELVIEKSVYMSRLWEEYARPEEFDYFISILENVMNLGQHLRLFTDHKSEGCIILYMGRRLVRQHEEFITNLIAYVGDEAAQRERWDKFFERYREDLIKQYREFLGNDGANLLLFEIGNRKVLREILTQKLQAPASISSEALVKASKVVNSLFFYARKSLAATIRFDDSLIAETYEKVPLVPRVDEHEILRYMVFPIESVDMPIAAFDLLTSYFKTGVVDETEKKLLDSISTKNIFSKEDLKKVIGTYPLSISDRTAEKMISALKEKLSVQLKQISSEKNSIGLKVGELKTRLKDYASNFAHKLYESAQNFSTQEIMKGMIGEMSTPLIKMGYYLRDQETQNREMAKREDSMRLLMQIDKATILSWIKNIPYRHLAEICLLGQELLKFDDVILQRELKDAYRQVKSNKVEQAIMNRYKKGGLLSERFETTKLVEVYQKVIKGTIRPLVTTLVLEELIDYFPPLGTISQENLRFLAEQVAMDGVCYITKDGKRAKAGENLGALAGDYQEVEKYRSIVSVLVYDIRGSTFMGTKLRNAQKESEIRNLFNKAMLEVILRYGGLPIKDTGDGGIVFFCENGRELYGALERSETIDYLCPRAGPDMGMAAARCACDMVKKAEDFVQDNLLKYSEWFKDVEEREIKFEGVTLATLPPEYKKIFQIGVGIASGFYPREVYLEHNAYDEADLSGMLVREANIFSKAKNPERSLILCDDVTVYNLLLTTPKFSFYSEQGLKLDPIVADVIRPIDYWLKMREERRGFIVEMFKILARRIEGNVSYDRGGRMFAAVGDFGMALREEGPFVDSKGGRTKYLFELSRG